MPLPVQNTCTPQDIFGGFEQTIFLGCSVISYSLNGGLNEQKGEVTIQLIEDPCSGPKVYYDRSLVKQNYTGADPGFIGEDTPIIGVPAYFRMADFEFSGIIQDWVKADIRTLQVGLPVKNWDINTNVYVVKLEDPREILSAAQIIVNEYAGFTSGFDNIVNPYGFLEAISVNCPPITQGVDGTIFGSPAAGFGGADVDDNGMPWHNILAGTRSLLTGRTTVSPLGGVFSNGYLSFKGVSNTAYSGLSGITAGMGILDQNASYESHYVVDLTSLPAIPSSVRMNGTSFSLLDLISQVCEIAGYDYYVELLPVENGVGWTNPVEDSQGIVKIIKIRTINRDAQPVFGAIEEFINIADDDGIGSINNDMGRELRNEITQQLVIGGAKQNVFDTDEVDFDDPEGDGDPANAEADDMVVPYFGLDNDGNAIIPEKDADGFWFFEADIRALNYRLAELGHDLGVTSVTITEGELIAAISGKDTWFYYTDKFDTDFNQAFGDLGTMFAAKGLDKAIEVAGTGEKIPFRDTLRSGHGISLPTDTLGRNKLSAIQIVFDFVNQLATEYYGLKFQVRVPNTCAYIPTSQDATFVGWGGKINTSEVPSDGGWTEKATLLGLTNPSANTDFFRLEDGRIQNIVRFTDVDNLSIVDLDTSSYIGDATDVWVKADSEPEYVYMDKATMSSPRIVVSISSAVSWKTQDRNPQLNGLARLLNRAGEEPEAVKAETTQTTVGGAASYLSYEHRKRVPNGAAVCIKSNALKYGPYGSATVAGKANIRNEEGLVPWAYGSYSTMDAAGNALASEGVTSMQVGERGTLVVPGYPTVPLGAELLAASAANSYAGAGPFNGGGTNLYENRTLTVTGTGNGQYVSTTMPLWTGAYGPNITGITTQVSTQGINTTYTMRTYTPKFGRFAHFNAERLKQIGQNNMKYAKASRAINVQRLKGARASQKDKYLKGLQKQSTPHAGREQTPHTPHEFLVGEYIPWHSGAYQRPIIADSPMIELAAEFTDYSSKAFMSWDGLILPISMDGDGGLPGYTTPLSGCPKANSKAPMPPIDKSGEAGQLNQYNLDINVDYLNPFTNPSGLARSQVSTNRSDTPAIGHHIDIIGRAGVSGNPPASSMVMAVQGHIDNTGDKSKSDYQDDVRGFGLRGPLVMIGWGYDLNGFPVPNKGVGAAKQNKFADNWLRKPDTWPVGPIDLRWDEDRAVWASPPAYRFVKGQLTEDLAANGTAVARLIDGATLYDSGGSVITNPEFEANDWIGQPMASGKKFIAAYDTVSCEYHVLHSAATVKNQTGCKNSSYFEALEGGNVNVATDTLSLGHLDIGSGLVILENITGGAPVLRTSSLISYTSILANTGDCIEYGSSSMPLTDITLGNGLVGVANTGTCGGLTIQTNLVALGPDPADPCVMWEGSGTQPNAANNFSFNQVYFRNGLVATTGQLFCDSSPYGTGLYLGIDIEVSGKTSALADKHWHGARGFTFGSGFTVSDTGCLAPIGLFYGSNSGSQVIITGVTCSGTSLIVGSGELVWKYGQISGVRPI